MKREIVGSGLVLALALSGCAAHPKAPAGMGPKVATLMTEELPAGTGREVRMLTVEYPPGGKSAAHRHPGAVFVYVVEGAVRCGLDDEPVKTYEAGQNWWERPGQVHRVSENASATKRAKLVVFFVTEPGKKVTEGVK